MKDNNKIRKKGEGDTTPKLIKKNNLKMTMTDHTIANNFFKLLYD